MQRLQAGNDISCFHYKYLHSVHSTNGGGIAYIYIYYLNSCTMTSGMFMYSNGTCKVEWYADIGDWWMHLRPMIRRQDVLL